MQSYILLTRLSPEAVKAPTVLETLERDALQRIRTKCPNVEWLVNYAIFGPWDYLDIFRAPDMETAAKVATLIRAHGHAETELWPAVEWDRFKELMHELADSELVESNA